MKKTILFATAVIATITATKLVDNTADKLERSIEIA